MSKVFICKEDEETFYIYANNWKEAREGAALYNGIVIREMPPKEIEEVFKEYEEFPYEEIRKDSGDYFASIQEMEDAGFEESQMWSVTCADGDHGVDFYCYGPRNHWIDLVGYVATKERHDGDTYYNEPSRSA
tara:strand:- start:201 stop:599 length:399 start_codon:yes stop_codon:yes gene_type:complete